MNPYRPTFNVVSTEPYEKAKQDMITALNSIRKLSPMQREMLAKDLFGAANVALAVNFMQRIF